MSATNAIRLIYVAGRYRAPTFEGIAQNISAAREVGVSMARLGWYPVIPHCNTAHMELNTPEHGDEFWLAGTLELMTRCDAVVLIPGWGSSEGTKGEIAKAEALGLPVYKSLDAVPLPNAITQAKAAPSGEAVAVWDAENDVARPLGYVKIAGGTELYLPTTPAPLADERPIECDQCADRMACEAGSVAMYQQLAAATKRLLVMARTVTDGPDAKLMDACEQAEKVLTLGTAGRAFTEGAQADPCSWSDAQVLEFLGVALRNVDLQGAVKISEIRQGFQFMRERRIAAHPADVLPVPRDIEPGVNRCVEFLINRAEEYARGHGSYDDDTGCTEFRNPHQEDYYNDLHELADALRALLAARQEKA